MPSNVRVAVRMRPLLQHEIVQGHQQSLVEVNSINQQISIQQDTGDTTQMTKKQYKFDKVIDSNYSQSEVFEQLQVKGLINKVMDGFNATIFAYGQTGSGKTYTMEGYKYDEARANERAGKPIIQEDDNNGITVRAIREVFNQAKEVKGDKIVNISVSFLQIYNEKVFDLLNTQQLKKANMGAQNPGLKIRWNKNDQFTVENLYVYRCENSDQALLLFNKGIKNKVVASHNLNHASSRSHALFTINLEIIDNQQIDNVINAKLQLVDLAGSERSALTGNTGLAQKESIDINKSLFTLRKVITSLAESFKTKKQTSLQHIPYRDSKLTCLLKSSLGGNSFCLMIACLSPSDQYLEENISTLNYATKASFISNEPIKNEDPKMKLINDLKTKVASLQKELAKANQHIQFLSNLTGQEPPDLKSPTKPKVEEGFQFGQEKSPNQNFQNSPEMDQENELMKKSHHKKPVNVVVKVLNQQPLDQNHSDFVQNQNQNFSKLDPEALSQKLIESVAMVKEFMQYNKQYRETIEQYEEKQRTKDSETYVLQTENRDLRDRIELLESVIGTQAANEFDNFDWRELLQEEQKAPQVKSNNPVITEMVNELIETRKAMRKLEEQNAQLLQSQGSEDPSYFKNQDSYFEQQVPMVRGSQSIHQQYSMYQPPQHQYMQQYSQQIPPRQKAPLKHQQSAPQSKDEALKMLNEMMNKRVSQKKSKRQ